MKDNTETHYLKPREVIDLYGTCLELVPADPVFHDISIGLYVKGQIFTIWTFSRKSGVSERINDIRDRLVKLGGMAATPSTHNQAFFDCGHLHGRAVRFLIAQAVGKAKEYSQPSGDMSIKDSKTELIIKLSGFDVGERYAYSVLTEGEAANPSLRLRMIIAGFLKYGEMEKAGDGEVCFPCGNRHDELMRLLLPYSRNVSAVESMMEAEAMRGQMTTNTLGFTPPT